MGAWIETSQKHETSGTEPVAPRVGAWIETPVNQMKRLKEASHPVWVRGLKHSGRFTISIETVGRTPCGCVD